MSEQSRNACPFCGEKRRERMPILRLCRETRPGQLSVERNLVVYHNLTLYKWHVFADVLQGPEADQTPQGYCVFHEGRWLLVNQGMESLTSPSGRRVGPKEAVELTAGAKLQLAQGPYGRTAEVQIV